MPREMLILILLAVVALMVIVLRLEREQRRQREAVRQVRESKLYAHVYPLLRKYEHESIEQVMLDRSGLYIRLFYPAGRMLTYRFEMHGLHPIPEDRLYPLAQALGVDLKDLSKSAQVRLQRLRARSRQRRARALLRIQHHNPLQRRSPTPVIHEEGGVGELRGRPLL